LIKQQTSDGIKTVARIRCVVDGGVKRVIRIRQVNAALGLDVIFNDVPSFSVAVTPSEPAFSTIENPTIQGNVTAVVTGGMAPFSYAWTVLSSTYSTTITNPSSATATLRQTGVISGDSGTAEIRLVANESGGQSSTIEFTATFTNFGIA
jgi:hypothetical protein